MPGSSSTGAARLVSGSRLPTVVRRYFDALNAEDWDALDGVWSEQAELAAVGSRPRRGREAVMAYFRPLFDPWSSHLDSPTRVIDAGETVVVEVEFSGVSRTGKRLSFDAVDIFDLDGGEIVRLATWYDLTWLRKQL